MSQPARPRFSARLLPLSLLLAGGAMLLPDNLNATGCTSCSSPAGAYQSWRKSGLGNAFPSLNKQFGGSDAPRTVRLTHTGLQTVEVTHAGKTTELSGNETEYVPMDRGGEGQPLPGEPSGYSSTTTDDNGAAPGTGETKAEDSKPCPCLDTGSTPTQPPKETSIPDGAEGDPPTTTTPQEDTAEGGNDTSGNLPDPGTPSAPGDPPPLKNQDPNEKNGVALQSSPGEVKALTSGGSVYGGEDVAPRVMVAVALGKSDDNNGTAGYLVPDPNRPLTGGAGTPPVGPEKIAYYMGRGLDGASYYNGVSPGPGDPVTGDFRWDAADGLTVLSQETSTKARLTVYLPGDYDDFSTGYAVHSGAVPRRITTVEKLSTGNPDITKYTTGYRVRTAVTGRPVRLETTWTSEVVLSGANTIMYSRIERALESIPGSTISESVSTRTSLSTDRTIDLTTTEQVQQPSVGASPPTTETIVFRSQEKRRVFSWGEETIESTTFLTPSTSGTSLTAYTDWYDVAPSDPNYAMVRLRREADGRWEAFFRGVADTTPGTTDAFLSGSVRGWKNTAAPTGVTTASGLAALADDAGYTGTVSSTRLGQRALRTLEYANGSLVAKTEDLTPHLQFRTTTKRYADASTWFVTVSTRYSSGYPKDTFELKANTLPASLTADPAPADAIRWQHSSDSTGTTVITVDDAAHLPTKGTIVVLSATNRTIQSIEDIFMEDSNCLNPDGSPSSWITLNYQSWDYDDRDRPRHRYNQDSDEIETWTYPTEFSVDHTDMQGVRSLSEYDPQGRLLRASIYTVPSLTVTDMPGSPVLPAQSYFHVTEWLRKAPTVPGTISGTTHRIAAKSSITGTPATSYRQWTEHIDGLGRPVSTVDQLSTTRNMVYDMTSGVKITTSIPGSLGGTLSEESTYLSGQRKSTLYPSISTLLGKAGLDVYYDYATGTYFKTDLADHNGTFNSTNGYESKTVDGLGRITAIVRPTGMSGSALNIHTETRTYDSRHRLLSRSLPGAPSALYEVFSYIDSPGGSGFFTRRALSSADALWDSADKNQSIDSNYYDVLSGYWTQMAMHWQGDTATGNPHSAMYSRLGEFSAAPETTTMGTWKLTGSTIRISGGATVQELSFRIPGTALSRTRRYTDGRLTLSVTSYNGLPLLYDTNGTTYSSKIASYSLLRDRQSEVNETSKYWDTTLVTPSTGLPSTNYISGGSYRYTYSYRTGNDVRAGGLIYKYKYADSAYIYYDQNALGQTIRQWGAGASPAQMAYDDLGRLTTMSTWRSGTWTTSTWPASPPAADATQWTYPSYLPLQLSKIYPDAGGQDVARRTVGYSYHPNGSLATRTWQRMPGSFSNTAAGAGVVTSYIYDSFARLQTVDYPAATTTVAATPDVSFTYDTAGRISTRTEAGQATTTYLYTEWGAPRKETVASLNTTAIASSEVERTFDANNRIDLLKVKSGATVAPDVDHAFYAAGVTYGGMLQSITSDSRSVSYAYNGIGTTPTGLTYAHSGTPLLSTVRSINADGLVDGVTHSSGATLFQSYSYIFNVDRVTSATHGHEGNMKWDYRYDQRGQVTSADKKFTTGTGDFAAGLQTEYTYDMAGNRLTKAQGGDATTTEGTGVRTTTYGTGAAGGSANILNQIASITNPSSGGSTWIDVTGQRSSSAETIKVNAVAASYQQDPSTGLSFRKEVSVTPNTYNSISVTSTVGTSTTTLDSGYQFAPPTAETLTYDADGNLLSDGRWIYRWDAENRLASLSKQNPASAPSYTWNYTFLYDGLSRRIGTKIDWYFTPGLSYYMTEYDAFVFDGWNLVMSGKNTSGSISSSTRMSYVWGPDIGSIPDGHTGWRRAGGVGGLVAVLSPTDTNRMFPLSDRMGNVTGYRKAVSGTPDILSAVFEYDPFGREVRSSGPASDAMRFRFSTKYHHNGPYTETDTGLIYYGYRFYNPTNGRWLSRDPLGEKGGLNLYQALKNNSQYFIDPDGMAAGALAAPVVVPLIDAAIAAAAATATGAAALIWLDNLINAMAEECPPPKFYCVATGKERSVGAGYMCEVQCYLNGIPLPIMLAPCNGAPPPGSHVNPPKGYDPESDDNPEFDPINIEGELQQEEKIDAIRKQGANYDGPTDRLRDLRNANPTPKPSINPFDP